MSDLAVVGAGYVGLTTAACFAHLGHHVVCADVDEERVRALSKGEVPILEEGLPALVVEGLQSSRLRFVASAAEAARDAEFVFICVQTPRSETGAADLSVVEEVAAEIAPVLKPGSVVVNKSTMPVGSTDAVARALKSAGAVTDVGVASNPEFLREGQAVRDLLAPHRVVIGCSDTEVAVRVSALYRDIQAPVLVTDPASAEMIKYASNAFLATKISFVNAIANLCELVNADVREVVLGMGYDPRIGFEVLHPGPGFGGSCFPKDTAALLHTAEQSGYDFGLLRSVIDVNVRQRELVIDKLRNAAGGDLAGVNVGIWGLAFKANTDDLRESPAMFIVRQLLDEGAVVRAYDPGVRDGAAREAPALELVADAYEAAAGVSVLALLTEWDEFRWLDFGRVREAMAPPYALVDARNLLDPAALRRRGFSYQGVGR
ncbi:MAG TPA: UDP-glucose/GDP-mannose dehydrogenase family protein [Acidimicrobiia bacterium]|nr:UDP-glucose/GDP-mannose dehydrogenase family protein [Acidimicrobiia bacterium]